MKKILTSLLAIPLMLTGLSGCASAPVVKEEKFLPKPKIERKYTPPNPLKYQRVMLALGENNFYLKRNY